MAAGKWKSYDKVVINKNNGVLDLSSTTNWYLALFLSTSNCDTLTAHEKLGDLTNEHANANGYTTGGIALTNVTFTRSGNVATFDCDDAVFAASGGSIVAYSGVIYKNATVGGIVKPLLATCLLNYNGGSPASVTTTTGNNFTIACAGVLTETGANSNT